MKKQKIMALILAMALCLGFNLGIFASAIEHTRITIVQDHLIPNGYYLCTVWDGKELLQMFDCQADTTGKLEGTVQINKAIDTDYELTVKISGPNVSDKRPIAILTVQPDPPGSTSDSHNQNSDSRFTPVFAPSTPVSNSFIDVPDNYWAADAIRWSNSNGYMTGNSKTTFQPSEMISDRQLWMILARLDGQQPANMSEARSWADNNGISDGIDTSQAITRQQLILCLYRYCNLKGYTISGGVSLTNFSDREAISDDARNAWSWAVGNGIITGTSQGMLNLSGTVTRAQFAIILQRFYQNIIQKA